MKKEEISLNPGCLTHRFDLNTFGDQKPLTGLDALLNRLASDGLNYYEDIPKGNIWDFSFSFHVTYSNNDNDLFADNLEFNIKPFEEGYVGMIFNDSLNSKISLNNVISSEDVAYLIESGEDYKDIMCFFDKHASVIYDWAQQNSISTDFIVPFFPDSNRPYNGRKAGFVARAIYSAYIVNTYKKYNESGDLDYSFSVESGTIDENPLVARDIGIRGIEIDEELYLKPINLNANMIDGFVFMNLDNQFNNLLKTFDDYKSSIKKEHLCIYNIQEKEVILEYV